MDKSARVVEQVTVRNLATNQRRVMLSDAPPNPQEPYTAAGITAEDIDFFTVDDTTSQ